MTWRSLSRRLLGLDCRACGYSAEAHDEYGACPSLWDEGNDEPLGNLERDA